MLCNPLIILQRLRINQRIPITHCSTIQNIRHGAFDLLHIQRVRNLRRFENHRKGVKSNRFAHQYGLRLLPGLYKFYNPMPYRAAQDLEVELAIGLREEGYGVWQA